MATVEESLLKLYASGTVEEVHADAAYIELCRKNEKDRVFNQLRNCFEELRFKLALLLDDADSYADQVRRALRWLLRSPEDQRALRRKLTLMAYGSKWSRAQKATFREIYATIERAENSFFFSFTSRNLARPALSPINRNHRWFIVDLLGSKKYDDSDLESENLLALALNGELERQAPHGFFYPHSAEDQAIVETKLRQRIAGSFAFVQMIQSDMFRRVEDRRNWCFFEYQVAVEEGRPILFIQCERPEDTIDRLFVHEDYDDWFRRAHDQDGIQLCYTSQDEPECIQRNYKKIRKLRHKILGSIESLLTAVPDGS